MFDFVNYSYSGILSILACLFGMSYPLVIGCIEKIDSRFHSTRLTGRFQKEFSFQLFKVMLIINLIVAVTFPFLMDGSTHCRLFIGIQCVLAVLMVFIAFLLFYRIIDYYNVVSLHNLITKDYRKAAKEENKAKEELYFTEWVDLTPELLFSADNELAQSVYEVWFEYVANMYKKTKGKECTYDQYFYDGVSRINETLCKGERKPISINNGNSIVSSLIFHDSVVSETSYRYLWRNLRIQLFYGKDEWIMEYWKTASQKYELFMKEITDYTINNETGKSYTSEEIGANKRSRDEFMEFHIMLCAMLIQSEKYKLVNLMLSFTQSEPPSYPLVPSTFWSIIQWFIRINGYSFTSPFYLESKYQMPNMHGITDGKILGAVNCYLALLVYRLYVIRWDHGYKMVLGVGSLPNTLRELSGLKQNIEVMGRWLDKIKNNADLFKTIDITSIDEAVAIKKGGYGNLKDPERIIRDIIKSIDTKIDDFKTNHSLDDDKVKEEENKVCQNMNSAIKPYSSFLNENFKQDICYNLDSSVSMPFESSSFMKDPDISHVGVAECMSDYMMHKFRHMFASSFYVEHGACDYIISSEYLFDAINRLKLSESHMIIAFGIYLDYFLDRVVGLKKESDYCFSYNGISIVLLQCPTEYFSQMLYVIKKVNCPYLKFGEPNQSDMDKLELVNYKGSKGLWMSVLQISKNQNVLDDSLRNKLGEAVDKYSLFTCIWAPKLYFKPKPYTMISIKVKYRLTDEGSFGSVDDVLPFDVKHEGKEKKSCS